MTIVGPQSKEERLEEAQTTEKLMSVVKFDMEKSPDVMDIIQRRDQKYAAEMSLMPSAWEMGIPQGLTAGLFSLAFFAAGNSVILQRDRGISPFDGTRRSPASSIALKLALYTFSLTISFANVFIVSTISQDKEKVLSNLSKTPLVEGRSILSDSFCNDLSTEYRKIHTPEYWRTVHSPFLRYMGDFVHNCELRRSYEMKLRKEHGIMSADEPVSIPPPGVPTTESEKNVDHSSDGDFDFGQEEDTITGDDWDGAFALDQEDADNSKQWK